MRQRVSTASRAIGMCIVAAIALAGCAVTVSGRSVPPPLAPNADLTVVGDSHNAFDQTVKNSLADVIMFWKSQYPAVASGSALAPLKGKLYSVDGTNPSPEAKSNACLEKAGVDIIVDNAFYCELDDSIAWDRNAEHLVPALGAKYGPLLVAMVFAHEFGHAVQQRLHLFDRPAPTIVHETQADCAAGAFTAWVMRNQAPHLRADPADLDRALVGYLNVRDDTPADEKEISHGDGFDRIGAVADGFNKGVADCYKSTWGDREFTERPYAPGEPQGGNESFDDVISDNGGLQPDLNVFWSAALKRNGKSWANVKYAKAEHPKCGDTSSQFGYCPADNTVYFNPSFAEQAYNSMSRLSIDQRTGKVAIVENQPGDFALGTLFVYGWALAVRHQLPGNRSLSDAAALLAASCYAGAYARYANVPPGASGHKITLSPPDMDEATSAVLSLVGTEQAYSARGTSGFDRVQAFVKGYQGGLSVC